MPDWVDVVFRNGFAEIEQLQNTGHYVKHIHKINTRASAKKNAQLFLSVFKRTLSITGVTVIWFRALTKTFG